MRPGYSQRSTTNSASSGLASALNISTLLRICSYSRRFREVECTTMDRNVCGRHRPHQQHPQASESSCMYSHSTGHRAARSNVHGGIANGAPAQCTVARWPWMARTLAPTRKVPWGWGRRPDGGSHLAIDRPDSHFLVRLDRDRVVALIHQR